MARKTDHVLVGPEIAPGVRVAVSFDEEGDKSLCVTAPAPDADGAVAFEYCGEEEAGGSWYHPAGSRCRGKPAMVASDAFLAGWEQTFGKRKDPPN